jgi:hypothetical protein
MLKHSEQTSEIDTAIAAAQAEMGAASKDSKNEFFNSSYADLASCWDAWRPAGPKHGLGLLQAPESRFERLETPIQVTNEKGKVTVIHFVQYITLTTRLTHKSGQWYESELTILVKGDSPQSTVLGITYGRRGSMCAITGIAPQDDDDGNDGANHGADFGDRKPAGKPPQNLPPCPACGKTNSTIVGKPEYGGGLVCFKNEGCKHNWETADHPFVGEKAAKRQQPSKTEAPQPRKLPAVLGDLLHAMGCKSKADADAVLRHCIRHSFDEALDGTDSQIASAATLIGDQIASRMETIKGTRAEAMASILAEALEEQKKLK